MSISIPRTSSELRTGPDGRIRPPKRGLRPLSDVCFTRRAEHVHCGHEYWSVAVTGFMGVAVAEARQAVRFERFHREDDGAKGCRAAVLTLRPGRLNRLGLLENAVVRACGGSGCRC